MLVVTLAGVYGQQAAVRFVALGGPGGHGHQGHPGAVRQQGMTVMAHNGATLVRIRQQQLSKRAQKFRRLLGLRHRKTKEINNPKN